MDVSASFQFLVDEFHDPLDAWSPDWRGYGESGWGPGDCYFFHDYVADLDALLDRISPDAPVVLCGHSLGGNVAAIYAGVRPERVSRLILLDAFGLRASDPEDAPSRYGQWLDELRDKPRFRPYPNFDALAARLMKDNPKLAGTRAAFLARHWGQEVDGQVVLRSDPAHRIVFPVLYRLPEVMACWRRITAPVLLIEAGDSQTRRSLGFDAAEMERRRGCFRDLTRVVVPDAGHMLHHEVPHRVAEFVESFCSGPERSLASG
jgi:pimeloyl-ACP methyl ester carboxylesterase